uniref:Putative secreted protein n=1 Tax=Anopheles marajoara TaxID=58244 RepID=A0A2M4CAE5_9DIPT
MHKIRLNRPVAIVQWRVVVLAVPPVMRQASPLSWKICARKPAKRSIRFAGKTNCYGRRWRRWTSSSVHRLLTRRQRRRQVTISIASRH